MFQEIGMPELIVIGIIVLLLFGVGRIGKIGKELGEGLAGLRKGLREEPEDDK